jgi:carbamoyl-phosphate synthase large subunit
VDTVLGPEMKSTGEVIGLDTDFAMAFAKSQMGAGSKVPQSGTAFISVRDEDKQYIVDMARHLVEGGFTILATGGTAKYLVENGVAATKINKVLEGRPHIVDSMKNGGVQLVINTTDGMKSISDSRDIRRTALLSKIPYYTTIDGALAAVEGIVALQKGSLVVRPLQDYFAA